ncbi:MAG: multidrug resistance protein, MFS family, partial [uncultured bacterium]
MISSSLKQPIIHRYVSNYRGLSSLTWEGISISFIESTLIGICYFISLYFVGVLHLSIANAGMIMSCYGIGTIFGGSIGGTLSDLMSPRIVSIGNLLLQSIGFFTLMAANSPYILMIALLIIGFGSYGFITSNHTWTLLHSQQNQRLKTINILDASSNLGLGISGVIISLLSMESFHKLFLIAGVTLLSLTAYLALKYD